MPKQRETRRFHFCNEVHATFYLGQHALFFVAAERFKKLGEKAMHRLIVLLLLVVPFLCGCGFAAQDVAAAREYVKRSYSNPGIDFKVDKVEGPEYANV